MDYWWFGTQEQTELINGPIYNAVKNTKTKPTPLYKLKLVQLKERLETENVHLPEHFSGKKDIKKASPPLQRFTSRRRIKLWWTDEKIFMSMDDDRTARS